VLPARISCQNRAMDIPCRAGLFALLGSSLTAMAQDADLPPLAVNYVAVSERIHTAGQPDADTLASLAERGFELVINLAPPSSADAVAEEGKLVAEDGPVYVNIPVNWRQPTAADFDLFSAVMNGARERKVLVHCQVNMRASAFTFLYRVVHEGVAPATALEALREVWIPSDQWAEFVDATLSRHGIDFSLPDPE
jgi:protein tyrosine phosphatase (PTP) superfamily phosphohydrolase (DUF442 family)